VLEQRLQEVRCVARYPRIPVTRFRPHVTGANPNSHGRQFTLCAGSHNRNASFGTDIGER
jgi:hypothetical protein